MPDAAIKSIGVVNTDADSVLYLGSRRGAYLAVLVDCEWAEPLTGERDDGETVVVHGSGSIPTKTKPGPREAGEKFKVEGWNGGGCWRRAGIYDK